MNHHLRVELVNYIIELIKPLAPSFQIDRECLCCPKIRLTAVSRNLHSHLNLILHLWLLDGGKMELYVAKTHKDLLLEFNLADPDVFYKISEFLSKAATKDTANIGELFDGS